MALIKRHAEMAELVYGARLEIVCVLIIHRGFESLSLRQFKESNAEGIALFKFLYKQGIRTSRKKTVRWTVF